MHENKDAQDVFNQQVRAVKRVAAVGALAMIGALTVAPPVLTLVLGQKFAHASSLLMIMSPVLFMAALGNAISVYVLLPRRMDATVSRISIITTLIGTALIATGAYVDDARGAAVARVLSEAIGTVMLLLQFKNAQREMRLAHPSSSPEQP